MTADPRTKIVLELVAEFVEERVRELPSSAFSITDVTRAVGAVLSEAGNAVSLRSSDDKWMTDWLDQHPFLLRAKAGSASQWKPGLNKGALRRA